ncbi:MAG: tyrosine-protein phosphatase, partial [Pseudomonadota bacterium]
MEDRVKPLDGVRNFRDFGGYATDDGRRVATGRLFRAGHFGEATDADLAFIDGLGIEFQLELRRPAERERQPNKWSPEEVIFSDIGADGEGAHIAYLQQPEL